MSFTTPPGSDSEGIEPTPAAETEGPLDPLTALLRETEGTATPAMSTNAFGQLPSPPTRVGGSEKPRRHVPRWLKIAVIVIAVLLVVPAFSFTKAMITTENLSFTERGAEWMRDNHLGGVLNTVESWWLSSNGPKEGGDPDRAIEVPTTVDSGPTTTVKKIAPHLPAPTNVLVPEGVTPVANEGVWQPVGPVVGGAQSMYTTQVRPDSVHTSILDGLVWIDPKLVSFEVFPGSEEPGGKWAKPSQVPMDRRLSLIAAFNGGFRMDDAKGGFYMDGVTQRPLRDGAASFVTYANGTATVGQWGRDIVMTPEITAVRQNLDLIIDNGGGPPNPGGVPGASAAPGALVPGLVDNVDGKWGATFGNKVYAWRSAVGVTADGAIVYGYGDGLSSLSLANLMLRAGCVRAMQLDINTVWTTFNFYNSTRFLDPTSVEGAKLLPESFKSANRYLSNDARDFVGVFQRTF